ncbi:MAG: hypothetical protein JWP58_4100 [Hymenobacter sp.]|nr:hypothetical protein [Hymenobacter sp.]
MNEIFISHAVADKPLVDELIALIEGGIGVPQNSIFCVSQPGQRVPTGKDFKTYIKETLEGAQLVIALITPNYYNSAFSMCELGGVWLQSKEFIPLIASPLNFADLKAVLVGVQALKIADETDLDTMRDDIVSIISLANASKTARWNTRRDKFLKSLKSVITKLPDSSPIAKSEHENALTQLKGYKEEALSQQEEIDKLNKKIERLKSVKDSAGFAEVIAEFTEIPAQFENLVSECKAALRDFSTVVLKTIFAKFKGDDYFPKDEEWEEAREEINEGLLLENSDENGVRPNESDTDILEAIEKLGSLSQWLSESDEEFSEWYSNTFKGVTDNIRVKPFWRKHLVDDRAF